LVWFGVLQRKSAAVEAWNSLGLSSCGVVWPDESDGTLLGADDDDDDDDDDAEIAIMNWVG
jgi:hypothetical protein